MVPRSKPTQHIRAWRKFRGISQEDAAAEFGIHRSVLSKIESGKSAFQPKQLEAAAKLYQCTKGDLLDRDPFNPTTVDRFKDLPPDIQEQLMALLDLRRVG